MSRSAEQQHAAGALASGEFDFQGWGHSERIVDLGDVGSSPSGQRLDQPDNRSLGVWRSTAICGGVRVVALARDASTPRPDPWSRADTAWLRG